MSHVDWRFRHEWSPFSEVHGFPDLSTMLDSMEAEVKQRLLEQVSEDLPAVPQRGQTKVQAARQERTALRGEQVLGVPGTHRRQKKEHNAMPTAQHDREVATEENGSGHRSRPNKRTGGADAAASTAGQVSRAPQPSLVSSAMRNGIKTSNDFASVMCALMMDLVEDRIDARKANALCNAGGKLLKIVEMQHKYGSCTGTGDMKVLVLNQ